MALKAANKPVRNADGTAPEVPEEIPRGSGGRPNIRALRPDGTDDPAALVSYTRASTLGKALENDRGLQIWAQRMIVHGLSRRPDLVLKAGAIATVTEDADKAELSEVAEAALEAAKATAGATRGTALHKLSEQRDAGQSLKHLPADALAALDAYDRLMAGFEVVASETFVVCDALETAGTFDRLVSPRWPMTAPDDSVIQPGDRLILDLKTNKDAKYFGPTYACQQAVYAYGRPYSHRLGRLTWPSDGCEACVTDPGHSCVCGRVDDQPRQDWALILHVPIETPEDAGLHWVDLREGYELAELARTVRAQRNRKDLFYPADPPREARPAVMSTAGLLALVRQAPDLETLGLLFERHRDDWWDGQVEAAANERADELERAA